MPQRITHLPFRRSGFRRKKRSTFGEAARGLGPILWALPLALFTAIVFWGGPPQATATTDIRSVIKPSPLIAGGLARCGFGARVNCVVDGDTLWHGGIKVRLADINTPEISSPGCAYEKQLGERATERLIVLLNQAPFTLEFDPDYASQDEDRYGRKLRIATRGGRSLGAVLVAEGLAEPWSGRRRSWC